MKHQEGLKKMCSECHVQLGESFSKMFYFCSNCRGFFCKTCVQANTTIPSSLSIKEDYSGYLGKTSSPQTVSCPHCKKSTLWLES